MSSAETETTPGSGAGLIATPATVAPPGYAGGQAGAPQSAATPQDQETLNAIDRSLSVPTLLFFGSAIVWLLMGSALSLLSWYKLVDPGFLAKVSWLTTGRLWPAQQDAFAYGWAGSAGIGAGLWIMARLCRVPLRHGGVLTAAWALWNLGLTLGVVGILNGEGTSVQWLEFPRYAALVIFTAYSFIAIWAVLMFRYRQAGHTYVSQWYLLASFLWFPWIYATANLVQFFLPIQPAAQEVVHWWYVGCFFGVWLAPTALAIAYYIVPQVIGRPVHRYGLAVFGFWSGILLSSWSGIARLTGGPVPAWMITVSIVASLAMLLPVSAITANFLGTLRLRPAAVRRTPSLRFAAVGVYLFIFASYFGIATAFRSINAYVHFTQAMLAHEQLYLAGFISFCLFGAIYYITPRVAGQELVSPGLAKLHFWLNAVGLGLMVVCLLLSGLLQGLGLQDAQMPPIVILNLMSPFLLTAGIGALLMTAGNVCFTASYALIFVGAAHRRLAVRPVIITPSHSVNPVAAPASVQ